MLRVVAGSCTLAINCAWGDTAKKIRPFSGKMGPNCDELREIRPELRIIAANLRILQNIAEYRRGGGGRTPQRVVLTAFLHPSSFFLLPSFGEGAAKGQKTTLNPTKSDQIKIIGKVG